MDDPGKLQLLTSRFNRCATGLAAAEPGLEPSERRGGEPGSVPPALLLSMAWWRTARRLPDHFAGQHGDCAELRPDRCDGAGLRSRDVYEGGTPGLWSGGPPPPLLSLLVPSAAAGNCQAYRSLRWQSVVPAAVAMTRA